MNVKGFTLIELSIVLVIIGLITGGVMAGRSLILASETQSIISDATSFISATGTFRDKYNAIPGDMNNAEMYWGSDATCPTTATNAVPKKATCNGNGNGTVSLGPESYRFWQHLADAGLIPGLYTGVSASAGFWDWQPGLNGPGSRISDAGYSMEYCTAASCLTGEYWPSNSGHHFYFGKRNPAGDIAELPIITPAQGYAIDSKIDDGMPALGNVMSFGTSMNPNCTTAVAYPNPKYDLTKAGPYCSMNFSLPF